MTTQTSIDKNLEAPPSPPLLWAKHKYRKIISCKDPSFMASEFQRVSISAPNMASLRKALSKYETVVLKIEEENKATEKEKGTKVKEKKIIKTLKSKRLQSKNMALNMNVTLSKSEIEEDFLKMTGKKPPLKTKKRHAAIQRDVEFYFIVEEVYLGMQLKEISNDRYNVTDSSK
ncbi:hypothetical protein SDJN03_23660, partial [Cucurbita argyrosperma subsp. sororia]